MVYRQETPFTDSEYGLEGERRSENGTLPLKIT
jgi:hypothetical protein